MEAAYLPPMIEPMKAKLADVPSMSEGWATEIKWDGVRAIAHCEGGEIHLHGRRLNDITGLFPEIAPLAKEPGADGVVLDGELVAFDEEGIPNFQRIQKRLSRSVGGPRLRTYMATFVIFDLLYADGHDMRELPYCERREKLESLNLNGPTWRTPDYLETDIATVLEATAEQGLEGLVVKRMESPYRGGVANRDWLKLKNHHRQEFVIGGWLPGKGARDETIGSLLLGYWDKCGERGECLRYAGRVGSGFSVNDLEVIADDLAGFSRADSPFLEMPDTPGAEFVNPFRVVEIEFTEWTDDLRLRHPVFVGMRRDKDPGDVRREMPAEE